MSVSRNTWDATKRYFNIIFNQNRPVQDSELNELQQQLRFSRASAFEAVNGGPVSIKGLVVTFRSSSYPQTVDISDGLVYWNGEVYPVPASTQTIIAYPSTVYLEVTTQYITSDIDPTLSIPAPDNRLGADRSQLSFTVSMLDTTNQPLSNGQTRQVYPLYSLTGYNNAVPQVPLMFNQADKDKWNNHIGSGGTNHSLATPTLAGFLSTDDKHKIDLVKPQPFFRVTAYINSRRGTGDTIDDTYFNGTHVPSNTVLFQWAQNCSGFGGSFIENGSINWAKKMVLGVKNPTPNPITFDIGMLVADNYGAIWWNGTKLFETRSKDNQAPNFKGTITVPSGVSIPLILYFYNEQSSFTVNGDNPFSFNFICDAFEQGLECYDAGY